MAILNWASKLLAVGALCAASTWANAQSALPVLVDASGNDASIVIGDPVHPVADVTLVFQDATGLSPASLGVSVQQVSLTDTALLARLPDANLTALPAALPVLITIEPPATGGLSFRNTGRLEIHTHALPYVPGSAFRVLKAPLGGNFRDVSDEIAQGSVRARTTYGGFSQFLIVADLRPTGVVINEKIGYLRDRISALPLSERQPFTTKLDIAQAAIAAADYATAIGAIDDIRARAQARAGAFLANEWRATRDVTNHAGELVAGAATLRFSVAYLRDYGQ
jgi:hypothetical protein